METADGRGHLRRRRAQPGCDRVDAWLVRRLPRFMHPSVETQLAELAVEDPLDFFHRLAVAAFPGRRLAPSRV